MARLPSPEAALAPAQVTRPQPAEAWQRAKRREPATKTQQVPELRPEAPA